MLKLRLLLDKNKVFISIIAVYIVLLPVLFTVLLLLSKSVNANIDKNYRVITAYNEINNKIKEENFSLLEKRMLASFSDTQLKNISNKYINYELLINGESIKGSKNKVYSKSSTIQILLEEKYDANVFEILPKKIIEYSSVINLENANKVIAISADTAKFGTEIKNNENSKVLIFNFSNVKAGEIITLEIVSGLSKKIGLNENIVEVFYNESNE